MQLTFQFDSLQAFLSMGGHGPYVWASYIITLAGLTALVVSSRLAKRGFIKNQQAMLRRRKGS